MNKTRKYLTLILSSFAFIILILDAKTALMGTQDGINLSLQSVVPSLFPFIIISLIFNSAMSGQTYRLLRPLCKICGIDEGLESIVMLGFLGGYPIGAQSINDAFLHGCISQQGAQRLLAFCNNAGPAFIFGIVSRLFPGTSAAWWLWCIHMLSALSVAVLLPRKDTAYKKRVCTSHISLPIALERSVKIMACICAWVVVFRIVISFCKKWFLWLLPAPYQALFCGVLELTNGIHALTEVSLYGQRFVFSSVLLALGGLCVSMQTLHVSRDVGNILYFPGKLMQAAISYLLSGIIQYLIFPKEHIFLLPLWHVVICALLLCLIYFYLHRSKKL